MNALLFVVFITIILFEKINSFKKYTPVIQIAQGMLQGNAIIDHNQYLGIPYATVKKRFQAPGEPPKWRGVFDATDSLKSCTQYIHIIGFAFGREDCLSLNVYTPKYFNPKEPYPVMVFIHGGGYVFGSNSILLYEPAPLIAKNVVVVTINYRLGALGFLCLGIEDAPGNAGLKDQVAALRWIQQNIKSFGGDPGSVTLFGESAGGVSAEYLMMSPTAKGLFHRAILQSGSSLIPQSVFAKDPIGKASEIAKRLGYNTSDPHELYKIYRYSNAYDIVTNSYNDKVKDKFIFTPCAEKTFAGIEPFLAKPPEEILSSGLYNRVPMIIGYNEREGILFVGMENLESWQESYNSMEAALPDDLVFETDEEKKRVARIAKQFYFGNNTVNLETLKFLTDFITDLYFHYPIVKSSRLHLKASDQPVYNYYYTYDSGFNIGKELISKVPVQPGASHGDELAYIFNPLHRILPLTGRDKLMKERLTQMWTDFAKTGNPTPSVSDLIPELWTPSNASQLGFYNLDNEMYMRPLPNPERIKFWTDIFDKYGI